MTLNQVKINEGQELIIVDDNKDEHVIFLSFLKQSQLNGIMARTFGSGQEFIEHMNKVKTKDTPMPGLVLLDIRMPVLDGFGVLMALRTDSTFGTAPPVLMFSSSDYNEDIKMAHQLGANGYKVKPRGLAEYIQFLNSLKGF